MNKLNFIRRQILTTLIILVACNSATDIEFKKNDSLVTPGVEPVKPVINDTTFYKGPGTKIILNNDQALVKGSIAPGEKPMISFDAEAGTSVSIYLRPLVNGGNVRISQIRFPDGKMDGPLGDSTTYLLTQKGEYTFLLGQNLMAGDPWTGDWILSLTLK